jgi:O-antigen/teichoic acid export membrane protein
MSSAEAGSGVARGGELARGITALYLAQLLSIPLGVVTNLVAGQFLQPADYGLFVTANFVATLGLLFTDVSLGTTLIRQPGELGEAEQAGAFSYQLLAGSLLCALLFLAGPLVAGFYGKSPEEARDLALMIRFLALIPPLNAFLLIPMISMERGLRYRQLGMFSALWGVVERLALIALIVGGARGFSYVFSRLTGVALQALLLALLAPWRPGRLVRETLARGWRCGAQLRFGFTLQLKSLSTMLVTSVIPALGGRLFSPSDVGLLSWSHNMATMVGQPLPQQVGRVLIGASHRLSGNAGEWRTFLERALLLCTAVVSILLAVSGATMPEITLYFFRRSWDGAAAFYVVSCGVMALSILFVIYDALLVASGRASVTLVAGWAWGISTWVACGALGAWLGPRGMPWGLLVSTGVPVLWLHLAVRKTTPLALGSNFFLPLAIAAAVAVATFYAKHALVAGRISLVVFDGVAVALGLLAQLAAHPDLPGILRTFRGQRR